MPKFIVRRFKYLYAPTTQPYVFIVNIMAEDISTTILLIEAPHCESVLKLSHNTHFVVPLSDYRQQSRSSREDTPLVVPPPITQCSLRLFEAPFNVSEYCTFGRGQSCDFRLAEDKDSGVSTVQFHINLDWQTGHPVLQNISQHGTMVHSQSTGLKWKRIHGIWQMSDSDQTKVQMGEVTLYFTVPQRGPDQTAAYRANLRECQEIVKAAPPRISAHEPDATPSQTPRLLKGKRSRVGYTFGRQIGQGGFGTVYIAKDRSNGHVYAAKVFRIPQHNHRRRHKLEEIARNEVYMLRSLNHVSSLAYVPFVAITNQEQPNIIKFEDVLGDPGLVLVMEYIPDGNLLDFGYRDVKPENILINRPFIPKLSDFGLSSAKVLLVTRCGTEAYLAPEIRQPGYDSKVDVWSLGLVLLEMLSIMPEDWSDTYGAQDLAQEGQRQAQIPVLRSMLQPEPKLMLSAKACLAQLDSDHNEERCGTDTMDSGNFQSIETKGGEQHQKRPADITRRQALQPRLNVLHQPLPKYMDGLLKCKLGVQDAKGNMRNLRRRGPSR
jgi:hypothetical protein